MLRRWEEAGSTWEVLAVDRTGPTTVLTIALCTCTGGEEVDRLVTDDPEVAAYVASWPPAAAAQAVTDRLQRGATIRPVRTAWRSSSTARTAQITTLTTEASGP